MYMMYIISTMYIRLGRFRRFPGSTRFQIENRNWGFNLLKNRLPASVGSGTETQFPKPALRAGSGKIPGSGDRLSSNWNTRLSEL